MKLWITKNSEVSVHDQLVAQITLGIASGDLKAGERLPSTRALARRFGIHQNTVSAAYRELAVKDLVSFRKGSGVYVRASDGSDRSVSLERLFTEFLERAASCGFSRPDIDEVLRQSLAPVDVRRYVVVESDADLRDILVAEIAELTHVPVDGIAFEQLSSFVVADGVRLLAMADEKAKLEREFSDIKCTYLKANSVPNALSGKARPSGDDLIAVISGWGKFIAFAKLYLLAAQVEPETVLACSTAEPGWKRTIEQASLIICDSLTAKQFSDDPRVRVFPLITRSSLFQQDT